MCVNRISTHITLYSCYLSPRITRRRPSSQRWHPSHLGVCAIFHFDLEMGDFTKVSPIHLKIKHSRGPSLTTLLGHSKTPLLWRLIFFDSEPKAWLSDVTITCSVLRGNYLKEVNALATIASVGVTVIAIHEGNSLLRASIHKLWAIHKPGPCVPTFLTQWRIITGN